MTQYGWSTHGEEKKAYDIVLLCKDCKQKRHYVHQLVAEAFLPNPYAYRFVRHKDGNGHNNYVNNLCWAPNCSKKLSKIN